MTGSVNKVLLLGNVGGDPDIRTTQSGTQIASFSLATNESWTDKRSGERQERTEWHRIVVFEHLVSIVEQYVHKGDELYLEGTLKTRKWQTQDGSDRYTTEIHLQRFGGEIILLGSPNGNGQNGRTGNGGTGNSPSGGYQGNPDLAEEVPF